MRVNLIHDAKKRKSQLTDVAQYSIYTGIFGMIFGEQKKPLAVPADGDVHGIVNSAFLRRIVRVCDVVGEFIDYWGFKAVHGRIWALLALSRRPLSQTQIATILELSRAGVSQSIDELQGYGLVRRVSDKRNAPYEAVVDVWPIIADVLRAREWILIEKARVALEAAIEEAESADDKNIPYDIERMRMLLGMTEVAQTFLELLMRVRTVGMFENFAGWAGKTAGLLNRFRRAAL